MIDAWDVYWVMQMDSIRFGAGFMGLVFFVAGGALFCVGMDEDRRTIALIGALGVIFGAFLWTANFFLPSTQTLAAMYVVPALTSDEVVDFTKGEARELLDITKQALRSHIEQKEVEK